MAGKNKARKKWTGQRSARQSEREETAAHLHPGACSHWHPWSGAWFGFRFKLGSKGRMASSSHNQQHKKQKTTQNTNNKNRGQKQASKQGWLFLLLFVLLWEVPCKQEGENYWKTCARSHKPHKHKASRSRFAKYTHSPKKESSVKRASKSALARSLKTFH